MVTPRLLKKNVLTFTRITQDTGFWNDDGDWVEGDKIPPFEVYGNLQPYRKGEGKVDLPEGVRSEHVKIFYTQTKLLTADDRTNQEPDKTEIHGAPFIVYDVEDWYIPAYRCAHYKVYLVREDKL